MLATLIPNTMEINDINNFVPPGRCLCSALWPALLNFNPCERTTAMAVSLESLLSAPSRNFPAFFPFSRDLDPRTSRESYYAVNYIFVDSETHRRRTAEGRHEFTSLVSLRCEEISRKEGNGLEMVEPLSETRAEAESGLNEGVPRGPAVVSAATRTRPAKSRGRNA